MKKNFFLLTIGALFFIPFLSSYLDADNGSNPAAKPYKNQSTGDCNEFTGKPNVLFIVADDLGYGDVKTFYPDGRIATPRIDKMAGEGLKLMNYRANPLCTQSRATALTGVSGRAEGTDIDMIAQHFKDAGYETGAFGKWHNGFEDGVSHPLDRGFDTFIGFYGGGMAYRKEYTAGRNLRNGRERYTKDWSHTTDLFADETIDFITNNQDKPFFGWLAFNAVHGPFWMPTDRRFQARQDWLDKIAADGVTDNGERDYYAIVEHMDDRIGDILDHLDNLGIGDNTIVVFLSDNGALTPTYHYGGNNQNGAWKGSNAIYRAGKSTVYEGGVRVPCVIRWPGTIPAGVTSNASVTNYDLYPTLREVIGTPTTYNKGTRLPGKSIFKDLINNNAIIARQHTPYRVSFGGNYCLVYGDWKLVRHPNARGESTQGEPGVPGFQLYHLPTDPSEQNNVAGIYPEKVAQMRMLSDTFGSSEIMIPNTLVAGDDDCIPNDQDDDSDNDGIPDAIEGTVDTDLDGIPDFIDLDSDNDCRSDAQEGITDSDGDGILDYVDPDISQECFLQLNTELFNPQDADGDGQSDEEERNNCRNPNNPGDLEFSFNGTDEKFDITGINVSATLKEYWQLRSNNVNSSTIIRNNLSINANRVDALTVRVRSEIQGEFRLFWSSEEKPAFIGQFVTANYATANQWQELVFNLDGDPDWDNQTITRLRLDFPGASNVQVIHDLDWIHGPRARERNEDCIATLGVETETFENKEETLVYPTATSGELTIETNTLPAKNEVYTILNLNGKVLKTFKASSKIETMDVSDLSVGLYMIIIHQKAYRFLKK